MKRFIILAASVLLVGGVFTAEAKPKFAKCPTYAVDDSNRSFIKFSKAFPGLRCSGNRKALLNLGYTEDGDPNVVQNPELDTERVFRGRGDVTISKAFRVSTVGRVISIKLSGCADPNLVTQSAFLLLNTEGSIIETLLVGDTEVGSMSVFNTGTYGVQLSRSTGGSTCDFEIRVQ